MLVIDDEADQASLNTKVNQGQESTTYTRLSELRDALPSHTLLQYTATPQALLLINIADTLSPDFVHVLQPGEGYVGGTAVLRTENGHTSRSFRPATYHPTTPFRSIHPKACWKRCACSLSGLSASIIKGQPPVRRSMLIHPAARENRPSSSVRWVTAAKDEWELTLGLPENDPDRVEFWRASSLPMTNC